MDSLHIRRKIEQPIVVIELPAAAAPMVFKEKSVR